MSNKKNRMIRVTDERYEKLTAKAVDLTKKSGKLVKQSDIINSLIDCAIDDLKIKNNKLVSGD